MPKQPAVATLQVLWEPWPDTDEGVWNRSGYEAFAGTYWLDALEKDGTFRNRGYRAKVSGCTTCRREESDPRAHVPNINDLKPKGPQRKCPTWKTVEAVVKAFGGWKKVHYVELESHEGLAYQPVPQRRREIVKCPACGGTGLGPMDTEALSQWYETRSREDEARIYPPCAAGCASYGYRSKGEVLLKYEGPLRPDRHAMSEVQRRMRV